MKKSSIITVVKSVPLFSDLASSEITSLIRESRLVTASTGQTISAQDSITLILKGSVAVTKQSGDKKLLMRLLSVGGVSGVASLFSDDHSSVSCLTAVKPTEALIIGHGTVSALIASNGTFAMKYISFLTSRIRFLNSRIKAYTVGDTEAKLAFHLLLSIEGGNEEIDLPVSFCTLADMLDMSRASLYRALDCLTEKGIIIKNGKKITVCNKDALKRVSEGLM